MSQNIAFSWFFVLKVFLSFELMYLLIVKFYQRCWLQREIISK